MVVQGGGYREGKGGQAENSEGGKQVAGPLLLAHTAWVGVGWCVGAWGMLGGAG